MITTGVELALSLAENSRPRRVERKRACHDRKCRRTNWLGRVFRAYRLAEKSPVQCERHRLADVRRNDPAALRNRAARLLFPCATRDPRRSHASSTARISETKHLAEVPWGVIMVQIGSRTADVLF